MLLRARHTDDRRSLVGTRVSAPALRPKSRQLRTHAGADVRSRRRGALDRSARSAQVRRTTSKPRLRSLSSPSFSARRSSGVRNLASPSSSTIVRWSRKRKSTLAENPSSSQVPIVDHVPAHPQPRQLGHRGDPARDGHPGPDPVAHHQTVSHPSPPRHPLSTGAAEAGMCAPVRPARTCSEDTGLSRLPTRQRDARSPHSQRLRGLGVPLLGSASGHSATVAERDVSSGMPGPMVVAMVALVM